MTTSRTPHPPGATGSSRLAGRVAAIVGVSAVVAFALVIGAGVASERESTVGALQPTGEISEMGVPVMTTPGAATGPAAVGSVEVDAANWELGTVPLDTAVRPDWTFRNTGDEPVTLGQPHPEVREGCCPGPLVLSDSVIPPGGEVSLTFELSMHQGMDGWHDIAVHVPVESPSGQDTLSLSVTGDFRNS